MSPLKVGGRVMHQIGMPYHWGPNGLTTGDAFNELSALALDPNVSIKEVKAMAADIRPGRRPRGAARLRYVEGFRQRAGVTSRTGQES
jgi:formate dehydrogenase major subunit